MRAWGLPLNRHHLTYRARTGSCWPFSPVMYSPFSPVLVFSLTHSRTARCPPDCSHQAQIFQTFPSQPGRNPLHRVLAAPLHLLVVRQAAPHSLQLPPHVPLPLTSPRLEQTHRDSISTGACQPVLSLVLQGRLKLGLWSLWWLPYSAGTFYWNILGERSAVATSRLSYLKVELSLEEAWPW